MEIDIYAIGLVISAIVGIVFTLRNEEKKALISLVIFLFILVLRYLLK